jgi:predicted O-methyltransferase YrrM
VFHVTNCAVSLTSAIRDATPPRCESVGENMPVTLSPLTAPCFDPTSIFELYRGNYASELLTAAVAHFQVFGYFLEGPLTLDELRRQLVLAERPAVVLVTALRAFGLLIDDGPGKLDLSELAREHLLPGSPFDISGYVGLTADSPGVLAMVERLRTNRPAAPKDEGTAFIYREGLDSAMEKEAAARRLTLALAGRARNVAPVLAERVDLSGARVLLDVGGGTGIYAYACLRKYPQLRAIVWDRPEVLKVASEMAVAHGVAERVECRRGDMFVDAVPEADVILLSNVLHDWNVPECKTLIRRCAERLPSGGRLLIHDVFLNDALDGPLPIALYSAALFCVTEGRAYSAAEYSTWLRETQLTPSGVVPTLVHCGVLTGVK